MWAFTSTGWVCHGWYTVGMGPTMTQRDPEESSRCISDMNNTSLVFLKEHNVTSVDHDFCKKSDTDPRVEVYEEEKEPDV